MGDIVYRGRCLFEPGNLFFFDDQNDTGTERVLIIRVTGMKQVDPVRAEGW